MPLFKFSLFKSKIEPRCAYCTHGRALGGGQVVCPKKGVMSGGSSCRGFTYDPMKRVEGRRFLLGLTKCGGALLRRIFQLVKILF